MSDTDVRRADDFVLRHRFTIAVVFPVVGAALLVASSKGLMPPLLSFNPLLILAGTLVMRVPLAAGLLPLLDRRTLTGLGLVALYAYLIETVGVATGWPYGAFSYGVSLGPMLHGVPLALPVFFVPLLVNSFLLVLLVTETDQPLPLFLAVAGTLVVFDLVLDPAAVALGFWQYAAGGLYGVPLSNYGGWLLSSLVTTGILLVTFDRDRLRERMAATPYMLDDLVSFGILWGGINLAFGNVVPAALAAGMLAALAWSDRFDLELLRGKTVKPGPRMDDYGRDL